MAATHYHVAPRYTPGSPAMVEKAIAVRVASEEIASYEHARSGVYGERDRERAATQGLTGIVEARTETRKGWDVLDLITNERFVRPFPTATRQTRRR